jgi:hypothetical protein
MHGTNVRQAFDEMRHRKINTTIEWTLITASKLTRDYQTSKHVNVVCQNGRHL